MASVLAVGIATLDIINSVDHYPHEDAEIRAVSQRLCRGGNATNTLTVLSQLGHACHWAGVLVDEPDARHILEDLQRHRIDTNAVMTLAQGKVPTSYITHNQANGSRTIIHYRDLPEYPFSTFATIDLTPFQWVHFEGRNVGDTQRMLQRAMENTPTLPRSLEVEKDREGIEKLLPLADLILFSRHFARERGYDDAMALLLAMQPLAPQADLICAWGEAGAWALGHDGTHHHCPAFPPDNIVDTLGAGDTFNAGIIDARLQGKDLAQSLEHACVLAGRKCGHQGLNFIEGKTA